MRISRSIDMKNLVDDLFYHAHHPYTRGLLKSLPHLNLNKEDQKIVDAVLKKEN